MGYSMIALTLLIIAINLSWAGYQSTSGLGRTAKLYLLLYKAIKKRLLINEKKKGLKC
jgi:hypothetical protein